MFYRIKTVTTSTLILPSAQAKVLGSQEIKVSSLVARQFNTGLGEEEQDQVLLRPTQEQVSRHLQRGEQVYFYRGLDERTSLCSKTGKWENCPGHVIWPIEAPTEL